MRIPIFAILSALLLPLPVLATTEPVPKPTLQVNTITTAAGVEVPAAYLDALNQSLLVNLGKTRQFDAIVKPGDTGGSAAAVLEVKGTITHFKGGSRAARIASGGWGRMMGVGETTLVTHVVLWNPASEKVLWEGDVKGAEKGNAFNPADISASSKVAEIEAEQIAKVVTKAAGQVPNQKQP